MLVQAMIQKWGNSLALRLTGPVRSIPNFKENMLVEISIQADGIQVAPVEKKLLLLKEKDLLKGLTKYTAHADAVEKLNSEEFGD